MISKYKYLFYFSFGLIFFVLLQLINWLFLRYNFLIFENERIFFFFSLPYFQIIILLALLAFIIFSFYQLKKEGRPLMIMALSLILGGGLSNLFDRLFKAGVADYFDLYFWRTNLADIFIFGGICLFFYFKLTAGRRGED